MSTSQSSVRSPPGDVTGGDPATRSTDVGTSCTTLSVATHRSWMDADGHVQTETEWTRCATWGKLAEIAGQFARRGSRVYVAGRLHTTRWEDAQTGDQRTSVEIVVDDLILLDRPTPTATPEDEQDAREPQPSAPEPSPRPSTQQPIRRSPQPVQLRDSSAQPSKRRRNDR